MFLELTLCSFDFALYFAEGEIESTRRIKTEFLVQLDGVGSETDSGRVLVVRFSNSSSTLGAVYQVAVCQRRAMS